MALTRELSPKEWQQGDLTEEELQKIKQPIGEAPEPAPEQNEHDQMVKAVVNLLRGVYRARYNGQEPDEKYLNRMRDIYASQSDGRLLQAIEVLTKEGEALKAA